MHPVQSWSSSYSFRMICLLQGHPRLSVVAVASENNLIQLLDFRNPETPLSQSITFVPTALEWRSSTRLVVIGDGERRTFEFETTDIGGAWDRLIRPVHYEGYEAPNYLWLPLPASEEAEPKYSIAPLLFGTFKAAFLALIFSVPLSLGAAIYVGFFMSEVQRGRIRPAIDMLTAFPTVVLGAIGLFWIAPNFERVLSALFGVVVLFPLLTTVAVFLLRSAGLRLVRLDALDDWPIKLLPLVLIILIFSCWVGLRSAGLLPGDPCRVFGDPRYYSQLFQLFASWISPRLSYNAHYFFGCRGSNPFGTANLSSGALALGSTPWQSYRDIVLPLAMPGMIAAVMIGFGRAAGETMILLILSGNTGVIDVSVFEGLRSVSASGVRAARSAEKLLSLLCAFCHGLAPVCVYLRNKYRCRTHQRPRKSENTWCLICKQRCYRVAKDS